jgi:peptidyl-prolyl cis-trans isomerase C
LKKDAVIAVLIAAAVAGIAYGVARMRVPAPMRPSHPFTTESTVTPSVPAAPTVGRVIMRINGEPVTEDEFAAAYSALPQELQQQYNSEQGKQAFAEQFVRMKLLEQEAAKLGVDHDPKVAGQLAAQRTDVLAGAAAQKLVPQASPQAVQKFYNENQARLQTLDLYHIVVAYEGGMLPPKGGGKPLDQQAAMNKALQIYQQLKEGASFNELAKKVSDDPQSAAQGGFIGSVPPGALPAELNARVFRLKEGEISDPIPSQFGIHIFKAGPKRVAPLAQVKDRIAQRVQQEETVARVEKLRSGAKVDFDPKFFPDAKNWKQPAQKPGQKPPA